jgi:PHD/YefM family antitoxin component YafN of YafNO toxin-antitoxin module
MAIDITKGIVPITQARARLTELADDVSKSGQEKIFTKNGESYVALITAEQLAEYHGFKEEENLSRLKALVESAEDIEAGRVYTQEEFEPRLARLRARAERIAKA